MREKARPGEEKEDWQAPPGLPKSNSLSIALPSREHGMLPVACHAQLSPGLCFCAGSFCNYPLSPPGTVLLKTLSDALDSQAIFFQALGHSHSLFPQMSSKAHII